ncbi:MAG: hypothetical protein RJA09_2071, partial [Pseudomonadota bacterium]
MKDTFETSVPALLVGGYTLAQLAARAGQSPFYAYDRRLIAARVARVRQALPPTVGLHYAVKANPMPALLAFISPLVDGMDLASGQELRWALDAGAHPQHVSLAGPGKREPELRQAVATGVLVNVESVRELPLLAQASQDLGVPARVALRVNPDFELRGSGMRMGGGGKPFGIDAEQVPRVLAEVARMGLAFEGFHVYAGSQNLKADLLADATTRSLDMVCRLADHAPGPVRHVNLGGGWGIPYFPGEKALDLAPLSDALHQ